MERHEVLIRLKMSWQYHSGIEFGKEVKLWNLFQWFQHKLDSSKLV